MPYRTRVPAALRPAVTAGRLGMKALMLEQPGGEFLGAARYCFTAISLKYTFDRPS
jgi:hypothetical protein